ncbi:MAG: hypothetical protein R3C05_07395 [Pirellulaceae bacterium]
MDETWCGVGPIKRVHDAPILCGIHWLYPWTDSNLFIPYENTTNRQWYYQPAFFIGRSVAYFLTWTMLVLFVQSRSAAVAGFSLVLILLSITWASMDWIMSFHPFFTSTLLGVIVGAGAMLSALAYGLHGYCRSNHKIHEAALDNVEERAKSANVLSTMNDLSGLLFAFLMIWAYLVFSQFLIMWNGNLPTEAHYYAIRNQGGWRFVTPLVAIIGFVVPFCCLLSSRFKRSTRWIGGLAIGLIMLRLAELAWMILPADDGGNLRRVLLLLPTTGCVLAIGEWRPIGLFNEEPG